MKTTDKNEIDLLLRALGRDASARSAGASSQEIGAHLDADELNCYAEGIVSSAERLRYNKHLADCDSCRRIVAGLVPAVPRRHEVVKLETGWNLRDKLAALFAPSVLRFAVPALALTAIIAIAIVALRRPQQTDFVAQNQEQTSPAVSSSGESQKTTTNDGPQSVGSPGQRQPPAESKEKNVSEEERSSAIQPPAITPKTSANATSRDRAAKGLVQPRDSTVAQSQPTFAAEPSDAPAPPPPRPALSDASKTAEARKQEDEADMQKRRREDNYSQAREENEVARPTSAKGGPSRNNSQNVAGLSSVMSRSANKDAKAAGEEVETRRVSGRLFHRQGNAWVDADYASGRATVNVSRGSEQFRALIADEPALRSIAEQLGGEVIVVWKGTAYRIR
ncbi:MAG TPA: zf-HC2 domain-containing protein [Pyrinomonadaceae bacterium]|nr:zf-HC2 domain-containing protein [Pyrinomonadaceae bacterium]